MSQLCCAAECPTGTKSLQTRTKEYGNPWLDSSLPVFYVGVNYDSKKRGIDDPLVEPA